MATPAQEQAIFVTGQLAASCTNLATAYPHGGTALGLVGGVEIAPGRTFRLLIEEETNAPYKLVWLGGPVEMLVRLRGWDADGVTKLFPGGAAGPLITLLAATIGKSPTPLDNVVWSPIKSAYPFVVLRDVIAVPEEDHRLPFTAFKNLEMRLRLFASNVSDALGEIGPSASVTL